LNNKFFFLWSSVVTLVLFSGCATTYYYVSGEKANVIGKEAIFFLSEGLKKIDSPIENDKTIIDYAHEMNKLVNPEGKGSVKKPTSKSWNNLSGVEYKLVIGERKDEILKKLGVPVKKKVAKNPKYDEIWEYDFCTMYFKKDRLRKLKFKKVKSPYYQSEGKRFLWFDIF
jgi:hypothetical protein